MNVNKTANNNRICKFCGQEKKLIRAHIIPRKFYLDYKSEKYVGVNPQTGEFVLQQCGLYDKNILCEDCDSKILRIYEEEGYRVLLKEIFNHSAIKETSRTMYHMQIGEFDYHALRRFFITILWRASVSDLEECKYIKLGPYEEKALEILKGQKEYDNLFKILIYKSPEGEDFNKLVFIGKALFKKTPAYVINMAGYFVFVIVNYKNCDIKIKQLYSPYFLNENNLYVIESEYIHQQRLNDFLKRTHDMWARGIKPPNIKL